MEEKKNNINKLDIDRYKRFLEGDMSGFEELVIEYKNLLIYLDRKSVV